MELKLQREIARLRPELTIKQIEEMARDFFEYWVDGCIEDVLEASRV